MAQSLELDNLLLIIAQTGVFIFAVFSIIGTLFQLEYHLVEFLASVLTLVQASFQTIFILDASCRSQTKNYLVKDKKTTFSPIIKVCEQQVPGGD